MSVSCCRNLTEIGGKFAMNDCFLCVCPFRLFCETLLITNLSHVFTPVAFPSNHHYHHHLQSIVNPKPFLTGLTGKEVIVKLKWGMEYKGNPSTIILMSHFPLDWFTSYVLTIRTIRQLISLLHHHPRTADGRRFVHEFAIRKHRRIHQ